MEVSYFHSINFLLKTVRFVIHLLVFLSLNAHSMEHKLQSTSDMKQNIIKINAAQNIYFTSLYFMFYTGCRQQGHVGSTT